MTKHKPQLWYKIYDDSGRILDKGSGNVDQLELKIKELKKNKL